MKSVEAIQHVNIIRQLLFENGNYPNNPRLALLIYQQALQPGDGDESTHVKALFELNGWSNAWVDGVYDYHHFHATTHEVLGVLKGSARIQFGGEDGTALLVEKGDVIIIPAGVAHKAIDVYDDFTCVGAYPGGSDYDIKRGGELDNESLLEQIRQVPLPTADPVYGLEGPLLTNWDA